MDKKTIKGSGGYIVAELTEEEAKRARLAGNEYFIGSLGRIDKDRIYSYHCNSCKKDYDGAPEIKYEAVNEVGEGYTLVEHGEYICSICSNVIALYKRFGEKSEPQPQPQSKSDSIPLKNFVGMSVYDTSAAMLGSVRDIALRGNTIVLIVSENSRDIEVPWDHVMNIKDIVLVKAEPKVEKREKRCSKCNYENKADSRFCEECGAQL